MRTITTENTIALRPQQKAQQVSRPEEGSIPPYHEAKKWFKTGKSYFESLPDSEKKTFFTEKVV